MFQLAEVLVTREMLTGIPERISRLRLAPGQLALRAPVFGAVMGSSSVNGPPPSIGQLRPLCLSGPPGRPLGIVGAADQGHVDSNISWRLKAFSSSGWFRVRMAACCFFSPGSWLDQELRPMILSQSVDCW